MLQAMPAARPNTLIRKIPLFFIRLRSVIPRVFFSMSSFQ